MNRRKEVGVVALGVVVAMFSAFPPFAHSATGPALPTARPAVENISPPGVMNNLQLVGSNPLIDPVLSIPRGMNAGLAIAGNCAFVGSRNGFQDTLVLDISSPASPTLVGSLPHIPGATARELKALDDLNTLVVENFRRGGDSGVLGIPKGSIVQNALQIYQVPSPCTSISSANLKATLALEDKPHEFFLWRDPQSPNRILAYVSYWSPIFTGRTGTVDIRVYDLTGIAQGPSLGTLDASLFRKAEFSLTALGIPSTVSVPSTFAGASTGAQPPFAFDQTIHSMSVSVDGTRVFASAYNFGFFEIDSTPLAQQASCNPTSPTTTSPTGHCLTKLNLDPLARYNYHPPFESGTHSALKIPGRPYVYLVDEDEPGACPWAWVRILSAEPAPMAALDTGSLSPAMFPTQFGAFALPENNVENCSANVAKFSQDGVGTFAAPLVTFSSHNPLVFPNLVIESFWSGGLRVVSIDNPSLPLEAGYFFPAPPRNERFCFDDTPNGCFKLKTQPIIQQRPKTIPEILMWSYPTLKDGLVYVVDVNSGLFVLKYTGPGADQLPTKGICTSDAIQNPGFAPCPPFQ